MESLSGNRSFQLHTSVSSHPLSFLVLQQASSPLPFPNPSFVFPQEAMEAEGTMASMGSSVAEINNLRQNFFQKFLDVRAERTLEQLEDKGIDVEDLDDEWGNRLKEVKEKKRKQEEDERLEREWEVSPSIPIDCIIIILSMACYLCPSLSFLSITG